MERPTPTPPDAPVRFTARYAAVLIAVPVIVLVAWLALPDGPLSVIALAFLVLLLVFGGIGGTMLRRGDLDRRPPRRKAPTPS